MKTDNIIFEKGKMVTIIDGKLIAKEIRHQVKEDVAQLKERPPCLAVVLVGNHPPSEIYVKRKTEACKQVGIISRKIDIPETVTSDELLNTIQQLNTDTTVDGILVQLPLPSDISPVHVTETIDPHKDVDGFHPINMGKLLMGQTDGFIPCTPLGIQALLSHYQIETAGKHVVIIGRSNIVGKPMASLLMQTGVGGNATVTVANRHTRDLKELCLKADILISAVGMANFVSADMVQEGAVVIDVGISRKEDTSTDTGYRVVGDVDFDAVKDKCSFITPVPGGVGPMTIAMLLVNTLKCYQRQHSA